MIETEHQVLLQKINFWVFSVCLKLVPCIALTYLTVELVRILYKAKNRRERLLGVGKFGAGGEKKQNRGGGIGAAAQQLSLAEECKPLNYHHSNDDTAVDADSAAVAVAGGTVGAGLYLELADNSPTADYDQSSKSSSRGGESVLGESGSSSCSLTAALLG